MEGGFTGNIMKQLRIFTAGAEEVSGILRVEHACFECRWARSQYLAGLERGNLRLMAASNDSEVTVGYVAYSCIAGEMEILNIAVMPEYRRGGTGRRLLRAALDDGAASGAEACFLDVRTSNIPAIRLYEEFGFEMTGRRKRYYPDNREDALLFRLDMGGLPRDKAGA